MGSHLSNLLNAYATAAEDNLERIHDARCKAKTDKYSADEFVNDAVAIWSNFLEAWKASFGVSCEEVTTLEFHVTTTTTEVEDDFIIDSAATGISTKSDLILMTDPSKKIAKEKVHPNVTAPGKIHVKLTPLSGLDPGLYMGVIELDTGQLLTIQAYVT